MFVFIKKVSFVPAIVFWLRGFLDGKKFDVGMHHNRFTSCYTNYTAVIYAKLGKRLEKENSTVYSQKLQLKQLEDKIETTKDVIKSLLRTVHWLRCPCS